MVNNNNEQMLTNKETTEIKKDTKKIVLLVIFILLTTIVLTGFRIYKNVIDVSDKNRDKFDYNLSNNNSNVEYDYLDFISYDSKNDPNTLQISIPKEYIYKEIVDIKGFADDLNTKYGLKLKQIGFSIDENEENYINFYADTTYKKLINAFVSGTLQYEFTSDNGVKLYLNSISVGDGLPTMLYENLLPLKAGDLIYEVKSSDYELLKDNVLDLKCIHDINTDKDNLKFRFDYMSNLKEVSEYIFKDKAKEVNDPLEELMPIILDIMFN